MNQTQPTPNLSLVAQSPLPLKTLSDDMGNRLVKASQSTAVRSIYLTDALIKDFRLHLDAPKTDEWRNDTLLKIDQLRYQNLDGIQAQFAANYISLEEQNLAASTLNNKGVAAKKALSSTPSPLLGAYNFTPYLQDFFSEIEANRKKMTRFANEDHLLEKIKSQMVTPKTPKTY